MFLSTGFYVSYDGCSDTIFLIYGVLCILLWMLRYYIYRIYIFLIVNLSVLQDFLKINLVFGRLVTPTQELRFTWVTFPWPSVRPQAIDWMTELHEALKPQPDSGIGLT